MPQGEKMRATVAKKLRKEAKKLARINYIEYVKAIQEYPLKMRLKFAWFIITKRRVI